VTNAPTGAQIQNLRSGGFTGIISLNPALDNIVAAKGETEDHPNELKGHA
jgi:hypothetical protein